MYVLLEKIINILKRQKDYVVEQGTSGIWTYRKWNSGKAECWGIYNEKKEFYTTVSPFFGYVTSYILYPSNLFIEPPIPFATVRIGNGFTMYSGDIDSTTKESTRVYALSTASTTSTGPTNVKCKIYNIGRWK